MAEVYEDPGPGQVKGGGGAAWSLREAIAKGIAGTIGILAALVIDYIQKGNDSALLFATKLINNAAFMRLHVDAVPAYVYLGVLLIAGFAMVYIFEPTNKRNAFYAGAGVLGFLATFSPIAQQTLQIPTAAELPTLDSILQATQDSPDGTPAAPSTTPPPADGGHAFNDSGILPVVPAAYQPVTAGSAVIKAGVQSIPVNIVIGLPGSSGGSMPEIRVTVHEDATGKTESLGGGGRFAKTDSRVVIVYQTMVSLAARGNTKVEIRVEAEGYAIVERPFTITPGMRVARVDIPLTASGTPLSVQRLSYPYRW